MKKNARLEIRLDQNRKDKLQEIANKEYRSITAIITMLIDRYIKEYEEETDK